MPIVTIEEICTETPTHRHTSPHPPFQRTHTHSEDGKENQPHVLQLSIHVSFKGILNVCHSVNTDTSLNDCLDLSLQSLKHPADETASSLDETWHYIKTTIHIQHLSN